MTETKYIPFSELKVGMEIEGWKKGSSTCFSSKEIKNIKNNTISFNWGDPLKNASDYMFEVKLTEKFTFNNNVSYFNWEIIHFLDGELVLDNFDNNEFKGNEIILNGEKKKNKFFSF